MKKFILLLLLTSIGLLFSCSGKTEKDVLVYAVYKEAINLDPPRVSDTASELVMFNMCEGLVNYDNEKAPEIVPALAKSWDISNDGLSYTFHLREGVKFHDGTDFNADAVVFNFQRMVDVNHPFYKAGIYVTFNSLLAENFESVTKIDDHTVVLKFKKRSTSIISKLATSIAKFISPTAIQKVGLDVINKAPVCTGAFKFVKWNKGENILVERNDDYWDKANVPKVKKVIFKLIVDGSARLLALKKGEVDIAEDLQPQDVVEFKDNKDIVLSKKTTMYVNYFYLNNEFEPLKNVKVRQAIAHLVDKQKIVDAATLGMGEIIVNPIPKSMWGYDNSIKDYDYNVEEAKRLLVEAGYPNGFEMSLAYNVEDGLKKSMAEILQNELAKVNIKVNLQMMEWGVFLKRSSAREFGSVITGMSTIYMDPENFLVLLFSTKSALSKQTYSKSGWMNAEFDGYNEQAMFATSKEKSVEFYSKAQQVFHREIPSVPLFDKVILFGLRSNVKNFVYLPLVKPVLKYVEKVQEN